MILLRRVIGSSMAPTLRSGRLVIAHKGKQAKVGSVVIARLAGQWVIKRVDSIDDLGRVHIRGDNQISSVDSKEFGPIKLADIQAVVIWPRC